MRYPATALSSLRFRWLRWALLDVLALSACSQPSPSYNANDIQGVMPHLQFQLTDETGQPRSAADYAGHEVVMYFGYSHCPNICPATMGRLKASLAQLPDWLRQNIRVLFVSVDPKRDSPQRLAEWTAHFGPPFIGLTGTQAQLRTLAKRYRVTYSYGEPNANGFYRVNHSSALFVFDSAGHARLLATPGESIDDVASDLRKLSQQNQEH